MTIRRFISISIRRAVFSLLLLVAFVNATAQTKFLSLQKDSVPVFRGFAVSFDLVGAGLMAFTDNGQYEGALRINLHDEWFPIIEAGLGKARICRPRPLRRHRPSHHTFRSLHAQSAPR